MKRNSLIKKIACGVLAAAVCLSTFAGAGVPTVKAADAINVEEVSIESSKDAITNKKLYIYSSNGDMKKLVAQFKKKYPKYKNLIKYEEIEVGNEAYYCEEYNESSSTAGICIVSEMNVKRVISEKKYNVAPLASIGFKASSYKKAYNYTKQMGTYNKKLYAVSPFVNPGCFIYNKSVAKKLFGSSSPSVVQSHIKDWDNYDKTLALCAKKGYPIVGAKEEIDYAKLSNFKFVSGRKIQINTALKNYLKSVKKACDKGSSNSRWGYKWIINIQDGKVLGCFGCPWMFATLATDKQYANKFGACAGPAGYAWGGSYMTVGSKCQNKGLAKLFIKFSCGDYKTMAELGKKMNYMPNNTRAVATLKNNSAYNKSMTYGLVGSEKVMAMLDRNAKKVSASNASKYDSIAMDALNNVIADYAYGKITLSDATADYKRLLTDRMDWMD